MDYVEEHIMSFDGVTLDTTVVDNADAYTIEGKLFAIYEKDKSPKRLSLRGDDQLIQELRERYESVVRPDNLDSKTWNTYVLTSQFDDEFIVSMITHSYIASGGNY